MRLPCRGLQYASSVRVRLDAALVKRGLASSRAEATRLIEDKAVLVSGAFADKPSRLVAGDDPIEVVSRSRFVSRGGEKLDHALDRFAVSVEGRSVLDAGASTGGFTDCLLQRGARRVLALDVGKNQLHERIKSDPRVTWRDGVNVRDLTLSDMDFACSLVVADLSFISLTKVLEALMLVTTTEEGFDRAEAVVLIKPQFEAGRSVVSKGRGVVSDPDIHDEVVERIAEHFRALGCEVMDVIESPLKGAEGNTEFLMWAKGPDSCLGCGS